MSKKNNPKPKGGTIRHAKPTNNFVHEVAEKNAGKVKLRIDWRTEIMVDTERLYKLGAQHIINEFRDNYER